jgi:hypothetical protein
MTGCRVRLEMIDGPRGVFGRLLLIGLPEAVGYAQWLLGQRLSAAASFQLGGTTYYPFGTPAPSTFLPAAAPPPPGVAFMPGGWQPHATAGLLLAPALQQQQDAHGMAMLGA